MDAKDFGQLLKDHPEMLDDSKKLAAILRDIYPREKGNVNLIITACNAGVVSMLRKSELDSLLTSRIINLLMDDYAIAEEKARWAAELWRNAYCFYTSKVLIPKPESKYLKVEKTSDGYSITGYNRNFLPKDGQIIIPNGITSIETAAFLLCESLTSIDFSDSITSIGYSAFYGCKNLTSVNLPDGITSIGDWAFIGCKNLTSINLPDSITSIGTGAFRDCKNLIIHCSAGFYAERYAKENGIAFQKTGI